MSQQLLHYSTKLLESVHSCEQNGRLASYVKPVGLWVSVTGEDDWPTWCFDNDCFLERLAFAHEIILSPDARVLRLAGIAEIDAFAERFGTCTDTTYPLVSFAINWTRVAEEYQGIIIAPYCYHRRLEAMWYYGWDCASGCIWDAAAVESIVPIQREVSACK